MQLELTEKFLAKLLAYGASLTTIFLISGGVTDPVNAPKLLILGIFGTAGAVIVFSSRMRIRLQNFKLILCGLTVFLISIIISSFHSKAPLTQLLYGTYGRNNGVLTYIFLIFALISMIVIQNKINFKYIVQGILFAGIINLAYNFWVIVFGDFVGWHNPFGNILGTLGNPNFIGSFLGIIFSTLFALVLENRISIKYRIYSFFLLPLCAFEILESHAVQGRVVAVAGITLVTFLFLRSKSSHLIVVSYSILVLSVGILALLGALQKGPFSQYIYKYSVSLRGQYWLAGWNTGQSHPFSGVGMDAFGDWYRRMRDAHALEVPGVNTVVNAAHSVPLDMFAFGGWPLLLSYLFIMGYSALSLVRVIIRHKQFDLTFSVIAASWVGYQLQSLISINQIGLAVWGWILSGSLISYERISRNSELENKQNSQNQLKALKKTSSLLPPLVPVYAILGALVGLFLSLPPVLSDSKWREAQKIQSLPAIEASMVPSYFNPQNSLKFLTNVQSLEQSNLGDLARKYALQGVRWNPDAFELWKVLYLINKSTPEEKAEALKNMKRLDPLNPDVTAR